MSSMTKSVFRRPQGLIGKQLIEWVTKNRADKMPNGCIIWNGVVNNKNRPMIYYEGKLQQVHRLFWEITNNKPFPEGLQAGHTCENSEYEHERCINPKHIIPSTPAENEAMKDINQEGTNAYKEKQSKVQLAFHKQKNKIMPAGLTHQERVDWILKYDVEEDENGCLIYTRAIGKDGYGRRNINFNIESEGQSIAGKKKVAIHRYIYLVENNMDYITTSIEDQVHHSCPIPEDGKPNPACVNVNHLKLGDRAQNSRDSRAYSKTTTLTKDLVKDIIESFTAVHNEADFNMSKFSRDWVSLLEEDGITLSVDGIRNIFRPDKNYWADVKEELKFVP